MSAADWYSVIVSSAAFMLGLFNALKGVDHGHP